MDLRPVPVPLLPSGRGALLEHVAPAGIRCLIHGREDQIVASDRRKILDKEVSAQHAGIEMPAAIDQDLLFQRLQDRVAIRRRRYSRQQRQSLVGLLRQDVDVCCPVVELA